MSTSTAIGTSQRSLTSRSMGVKFFIVMALAVGMSLPGILMANLTAERAQNQGVLAASAEDGTRVAAEQPKTVLGIRLADSYRSTRRSLHYITLFLGLVFLTYFLFEGMTGRRVHPAQYALVGIVQTIFYLLLLSFAEKVGFDVSFLIAGSATVLLFAVNAEWVFGSRSLAWRALAVFTAIYAFIYVLLRVESYALLIGAVASFGAAATAMYLTRNVDWYRTDVSQAPMAVAATGTGARESWLE